jgi:non-ribosomal peptide synthetase-like protein
MASYAGDARQRIPTQTGAGPRLLHEFFEAQVATRPDQIAVEALGKRMTYAELDRLANRIAHWLRTQGIGPGSLVGLCQNKSCQLFASMLGILKAGAGYVPVDTRFPGERIRQIFADAGVGMVVAEQRLLATLGPDFCSRTLAVDTQADEIERMPGTPPPRDGLTPSAVCYVIYTSGSTGSPKGVMIAHRNAVAFVKSLATVYRVTPQERVYQGFSVAFDASVEEIWAAFATGGTLVVAPEAVARSPLDAAEFITAHRVTFFSTVPSFLALIDHDLPTVRLLVLGGEACMQELVTRWAKDGRRLLNTYGPTETTVVATWTECTAGVPITIGRALPGYETFVLDERLQPVRAGEEGELFIGGDAVALGYLNQPELTAERFVASPFASGPGARLYRTHDLVRLGDDGALQFLGRIDGQVKIRGFRVELSEIETVLMQYPGIRAAAVRMVSDAGLPELAACVVLESPDAQLDRPGVAEMLRTRLPDYMIPKFLDIVEQLPVLTSGKVDRKQLPAPLNLLKGASREVVPPASDLERTIVAAWEKCLQVSPVSVEDDFFVDLAGHSLLAARVVTELRTRLATSRISVRDLYKFRTVRALSARLQQLGVGVGPAAAADVASKATPAEEVFTSVPAWERWTCVGLQAISLLAYYGIVAAPIAYSVLATMSVMAGTMELDTALWLTTALAFAYWPTLLALGIGLKWLVIGRYRPGRYPVWGLYYFRWWLVNRFQTFSWSHMFAGTPLMSLYWRAMGAKVGANATISTAFCSAFDLVSIGENASIGAETHVLGYRVENGMLSIGRIDIGPDCFVGTHSCLGLNTSMGAGARLDDMSALLDGTHLRRGEGRRGFPSAPAEVAVPVSAGGAPKRRRRVLYGVIHAALIYAMGYFLVLAGAPAVALVAYALVVGGPLWGLAATVAAVPLSIAWYVSLLVAVKWLFIGRIRPGTYALHSGAYLRYWFLQYALNNTRGLLLPVYATVYLPPLLRMLGARIGRGTEISTVMQLTPDLVEVGSGSFLADACMVGGTRIHDGQIELGRVRIGAKAFIGNSALVPAGTDVGDDALLGVLSCPMPGERLPDNGQWLGSPAFALPHVRKDICYGAAQTYRPTPKARRQRALSDAVRILLPGAISGAALVAFATLLGMVAAAFPWWLTAPAVPVLATALAFAALVAVAGVKRLLMGTFEPTVHPLWCRYVWNNEIVNGTFETIAEAVMPPLLGTPLAAVFLRLMGCRIGRWVYLETTYFSEFDLVDIGDHAALNFGATIQTHLFEDRVMKADRLRIGTGASVGNMAVVLYDTNIERGACLGQFSLLMKGESLPPDSRWAGIPSEPMDSAPAETRRLGVSVPVAKASVEPVLAA